MFKLAQSPAYWWPVSFSLPSDTDPGKRQDHGFEAQFKRLDNAQYQALMERVESERLVDGLFCKEVMQSFRGVLDDRDTEIPFSEQALQQLMLVPGVAMATAKAFFASRDGAPEKN